MSKAILVSPGVLGSPTQAEKAIQYGGPGVPTRHPTICTSQRVEELKPTSESEHQLMQHMPALGLLLSPLMEGESRVLPSVPVDLL